ncbi:hypothetical protein, partial [Klebsiella pneumoniae]|uniref:hypothetical protein n=1 Tax=Klebsiella pneumoniae TaxID=573 RepID=UPI0023B274B9
RAYCLKIQPATGSFARNLIYSTKPIQTIPTGQIASIAAGFCYGIKISAHSLLCSNVFDEEESKANCVTGGVANVTDGDWLYFLDHYASENYRRYRYFSQVTACPAILLKISSLIW